MKEAVGKVFSIAGDNRPVPGCTVSKAICDGENSVSIFSLDEQTDISAKIYPYHKLLIVADGRLEVYRSGGNARTLGNGEALLTETDIPVGMRTSTGAVYTEIEIRRTDVTNGTQKR